MIHGILQSLAGVPAWVAVVLLAAVPVGELRAAIPVGLLVYKLPVWEVFLLAQIGNLIPVLVIYGLCGWWVRMVERRKGWWHRVTDKVLNRTREKMHGDVVKWGILALILFVAIPLPGTGAWTGALGAYILHIPFKKALPCILAGNLIAGTIVVVAILSGSAMFSAVS